MTGPRWEVTVRLGGVDSSAVSPLVPLSSFVLDCTIIPLSLISYIRDGLGTVQTFVLAGFVHLVISRVAEYRRGLQVS